MEINAYSLARCRVFEVGILTWCMILAPGALVARGQGTSISDAGFQELSARIAANQASFFVYQDQDSGFNHGIPSGFFGQIDRIQLDSGCIDDPAAANGCSTDHTRLDRERGTVFRLTFLPMTENQYAGLNIEEPENWGVSQSGNGYDLRGAANVIFDVRSSDGATVQFGVGGCNTLYLSIPQNWTTVVVPFSSLTCMPDLSSVHILFAVATNGIVNPNGGTVLLDNIRFDPVPTSQQAVLSLPLSTQTFGVVPLQIPDPSRPAFPFPADQVNRNTATIYESALTILSLLRRGTPADLTNAHLLADAFDYALHHELDDWLPSAPDGSAGEHNGYENGDLALFNDQAPPRIGRAGDVRLAGFTAGAEICGQTGFCLNLDGGTGGNNGIAILALLAAYRQIGDPRYLADARIIGNWILGNLTDTSGRGYGGYYLGYQDMGVLPPKPLIKSKSTENNADIFAAFSALSRAVTDPTEAALWITRANVAGDFAMQMFDSMNGRFNVGIVPRDTKPAPGICPDGPQMGDDVINTCDFLDANTFTTLALAPTPRYFGRADWRRPVQYILSVFSKTVTAAGLTYQGFDLVPVSVHGADGVAWEFTGQAVVMMRLVDGLYGETTFEPLALLYLSEIRQAQMSAPFGDGLGVVASTLQDGDLLTPLFQCKGTPFQCIPERVGLAATAWAIFADLNFDPFGTF